MPFETFGELRYYKLTSFEHPNLIHAFFTRQGGYSPEPWNSLNMGGLVGDNPERVERNRILAFDAVGRKPNSMFDVWQVHGSEIVCTNSPRSRNQVHIKADAILTNSPDVTLFMRFADCVPILLFDPVLNVIGLAHAGWSGTVKKIASAAVIKMTQIYGCNPENLIGGLGPSISAKKYEIREPVIDQVKKSFGEVGNHFLNRKNGIVKFDMWKANKHLLEKEGIRNIEFSGLCTASNSHDWYSHRREKGRTGRFGVLIGLTQ